MRAILGSSEAARFERGWHGRSRKGGKLGSWCSGSGVLVRLGQVLLWQQTAPGS